jgi:uncharacterized protein with FMN-binding domain
MAGLARRIAPAAALGGLALVIVGVADPALAGHTDATATGAERTGQSATTTSGQGGTTSTDGSRAGGTTTGTPTDTASCDAGQAVAGETVMTRWGPVQVAGTVANGKLCEVHAVTWPQGDGRSIAINEYAIPQLDAQAAQSGVQFDGVSGATYTTEGYRQSLQSLLDSL